MTSVLKGLRTNVVALTVLALLSEYPKHPYEIQRTIRERHHAHAEGKTRALYHAVDRLTRDGLIEPLETSREGRRPERTVYQVTPAGRDELQGWVIDLLLAPMERPDLFAVATGFVAYLEPELARQTLDERARDLEVNAAAIEGVRRALLGMGLPRSVLLDSEHRLVMVKAEAEWLRSLVRDLGEGTLAWPGYEYGEEWLRHKGIEVDHEKLAEVREKYMRS
jgi:DNA-binding PadR family transcriptional regulator